MKYVVSQVAWGACGIGVGYSICAGNGNAVWFCIAGMLVGLADGIISGWRK